MNPYNMASNNITLTRAEMQEISGKIQEREMLKKTIETNNMTINNLTKENKELKKQIKKMQEENKAKEQDMKKKFMELYGEQKKVNSELEKYQAVPEFKGILDLYSELIEFRNKVNEVLKNDRAHQERRALDKKIEEYKQRNLELEINLKQNGAKINTKVRANELQQAEMELKRIKQEVQIEYLAKKAKINEMTSQMKNSSTKLVSTITKLLAETQKHLEKYTVELENLTKPSVTLAEKPVYEKIMNILLEQQNGLMKDMLQCAAAGISTMNVSSSSIKDDEFNYDSEAESPDENDIESLCGERKRYKVILHNVNEEWTDGLQDIQKIKAILKTFTTLSLSDVDVERIGKVNPTRKRPIKVLLPTFQHAQVILKTKHKLQNTCYSDIRICSYKKGPIKQTTEKGGKKF